MCVWEVIWRDRSSPLELLSQFNTEKEIRRKNTDIDLIKNKHV